MTFRYIFLAHDESCSLNVEFVMGLQIGRFIIGECESVALGIEMADRGGSSVSEYNPDDLARANKRHAREEEIATLTPTVTHLEEQM